MFTQFALVARGATDEYLKVKRSVLLRPHLWKEEREREKGGPPEMNIVDVCGTTDEDPSDGRHYTNMM